MTGRRAATIEPTIQKPISRVRALNNRSPSNSIALSSIRRSPPFSRGIRPKRAYRLPWSLRSEELPALRTQAPGCSKSPMRPQLQIDVETAFQQLLTALVLVLVKNPRLFLMTEIDLFER